MKGECLLGQRFGWWWLVLLPVCLGLAWLWELKWFIYRRRWLRY